MTDLILTADGLAKEIKNDTALVKSMLEYMSTLNVWKEEPTLPEGWERGTDNNEKVAHVHRPKKDAWDANKKEQNELILELQREISDEEIALKDETEKEAIAIANEKESIAPPKAKAEAGKVQTTTEKLAASLAAKKLALEAALRRKASWIADEPKHFSYPDAQNYPTIEGWSKAQEGTIVLAVPSTLSHDPSKSGKECLSNLMRQVIKLEKDGFLGASENE